MELHWNPDDILKMGVEQIAAIFQGKRELTMEDAIEIGRRRKARLKREAEQRVEMKRRIAEARKRIGKR